MSFLQNTTLLPSTSHLKDQQRNGLQALQRKSSLAALIQLVRNPVETVGETVENWRDGSTPEERARKQIIEDKKRLAYVKLRNATTYDEWQASAIDLDELEGNNAWKSTFESSEYDPVLVQARLRQLDEARISCDVGRMLFLVRTALTRELGDMGNLKLYKHSHIGTKDLIDRYINSALETLDAMLDVSARAGCDVLETKHMLEQVLSARQSFGRSALLLSGGATFGMNHIGVLKTLWERHLLPRIISGASAGSIVCAVLCTRTDEEMPDLLESFCYGDLAVFDEEGKEDTVLQKMTRFLKFGALFDISHLTRVMKDMLGDMTFQEAYNRTRRILNICVSSASLYELPRLLNYITAPNVLIWSAVAASCSVPFIFSPASIMAKDPKTGEAVAWNPSPQRWIDGSVDNDLPMTRLAEMFNVNHFIVSQVNPHVVPFLVKEEDSIARQAQQSNSTISSGPSWLHSVTHLAKGEALHRMHMMSEMGIFPNMLTKTVSVLSQKYSGDITIFPEISYTDFPRMLSNPTTEYMLHAKLCGERATWPKLSRIKNHCAIELKLDDAVQKLRARVVFSSSQVDLRLGAFTRSTSTGKSSARGRGKRTKHRRKMSQTSEPDASIVKDAKNGRLGQLKDGQHHKHLSINTFPVHPTEASDQPLPFSTSEFHPNLLSAPLQLPQLSQDLTSSGADTSATTSDSDVDSCSSSTESPYPPTSPVLTPHGSASNTLFPFASQPVTPTSHHSGFLTPLATANAPAVEQHAVHRSPSISSNSLAMTPKDPPPKSPAGASAPELSYKRLFHYGTGRARNKGNQPVPTGQAPTGVKRVIARGLGLDISGTRGMVLRKKKSNIS